MLKLTANDWQQILFFFTCNSLPYLSNGGSVDSTKLQLLFLLQHMTERYKHFNAYSNYIYIYINICAHLQAFETHIIFADVSDEFLGFSHGSRCWSEHRESLLVHLTNCHTLRGKNKISSYKILLNVSVLCRNLIKMTKLYFNHKEVVFLVGFIIPLNINIRLHVTCFSL